MSAIEIHLRQRLVLGTPLSFDIVAKDDIGEPFEFDFALYGEGTTPAEEFAAGRILAETRDYYEQPEPGSHCQEIGSFVVTYFPAPDNRADEARCVRCKARRKFNRTTCAWGDWELNVPWGAP
jgi:hypothetical protein